MTTALDRVSEIVWKISEDAFLDGRKTEREAILKVLDELIESEEERPENLKEDGIGVAIGLRRARLYVKEQKWI
jgi:hypothetical protein